MFIFVINDLLIGHYAKQNNFKNSPYTYKTYFSSIRILRFTM